MSGVKVISSKSCLGYQTEGHPESPLRVARTRELLEHLGYRFIEAVSCTDHDVLRVHSHAHLEAVRSGSFSDGDTPSLPDIYVTPVK